jgi:ABC-type bacteriocin/lantibiotic exporter with double-glycine peptidase domain
MNKVTEFLYQSLATLLFIVAGVALISGVGAMFIGYFTFTAIAFIVCPVLAYAATKIVIYVDDKIYPKYPLHKK